MSIKLDIVYSTQFKRDVKLCQKQGKDFEKFKAVHELLMVQAALPAKNKDHALVGNWGGFRECHLAPDWLLIYRIRGNALEYARMGSHAALFE